MAAQKKSSPKAKTGPKPMANEPILIMNIRLPASIKNALDQYAHDDMRPTSSQLRLILVERLKEKGYLK